MQAKHRPSGVAGQPPAGRTDPTRRRSPGRWALLAAVVALAGVLAVQALSNFRRGAESLAQPATRADSPSPEDLRRQAHERAGPYLDTADVECRRAVDEQLRDLDQFFVASQRRVPRFAERVLGWESTWLLVHDRLPGGQGGEHPAFVRRAFHEILFSPEQLEGHVRKTVEGYLEAVRDTEGLLIIAKVKHSFLQFTQLPTARPQPPLEGEGETSRS